MIASSPHTGFRFASLGTRITIAHLYLGGAITAMRDSHQIVSLRCTSCGAAMGISADQASAACSYCESNHLIERSGDVASLRPVMSKVQAEPALQRLPRELAELESERAQIDAAMQDELKQLQAGREALDEFYMNAEVGLWFRSWAIPAALGVGAGLLLALLFSGFATAILLAVAVCAVSYVRFSRIKKNKVEALELDTKRRRDDMDSKISAARKAGQQSLDGINIRIERKRQQIDTCRSIVD